MRIFRMRTTLLALGTAAALLMLSGCEGSETTTGGTSGTNGGTSGGATEVAPLPTNPRLFVSPGICYKGGTATFTITGGEPFGGYPVQLQLIDGGPPKKSWKKTTDENGDASWTLNCDSMPSDKYKATMTWGNKNEKNSKAFLDILREK